MTYWSSVQSGAFEPEEIAAMGEAYEAALKELHDAARHNVVPEAIARRIIAAGRTGERDPVRLREAGLARFGERDH
jgi:hypothetical protein